jgi:hypothetical protein
LSSVVFIFFKVYFFKAVSTESYEASIGIENEIVVRLSTASRATIESRNERREIFNFVIVHFEFRV